jgi:hypothetical protein
VAVRRARAWAWGAGLALLGLVSARPAAAVTPSCSAWPGEPNPLPSLETTDPFEAQWLSLRVAELGRLAQALEATDPVEAKRTWEHLRCLEPSHPGALAALERPPSARQPRPAPPVAAGAPAAPVRAEPRSAPARPRPAPAASLDWSSIDLQLAQAEELVLGARFRAALEALDGLRARLGRAGAAPGSSARRARMEVLAATVHVALADPKAASTSFERALAARPDLVLDAATTSPKVLRAFEAVRAADRRGAAR